MMLGITVPTESVVMAKHANIMNTSAFRKTVEPVLLRFSAMSLSLDRHAMHRIVISLSHLYNRLQLNNPSTFKCGLRPYGRPCGPISLCGNVPRYGSSAVRPCPDTLPFPPLDRKSTRLTSSHY